jgi:hypothetical protein
LQAFSRRSFGVFLPVHQSISLKGSPDLRYAKANFILNQLDRLHRPANRDLAPHGSTRAWRDTRSGSTCSPSSTIRNSRSEASLTQRSNRATARGSGIQKGFGQRHRDGRLEPFA